MISCFRLSLFRCGLPVQGRHEAPVIERLAGARLGLLFVERGRKAGSSHFRFFPHCLPFLLFSDDISVYYAQKNIYLLHNIDKLNFLC